MLTLELPRGAPSSVLCLGAHADDIEIGAGGTVLRLVAEHPDVHVDWVVLTAADGRDDEARASAAAFCAGAASWDLHLGSFRESYLPWQGDRVKDFVEGLKATVSPDLVLTHRGDDRHQDHRLVSELTWNTFRDHLVLEYEIPKFDGDLSRPNLYVALPDEVVDRKIALLLEHFGSQRARSWFDEETFRGLLRLRGVESNVRYAEAFGGRKVVLAP